MKRAALALLALAAAALAPLAASHGEPPPDVYDPLAFAVPTFLAGGGKLALEAPAAEAEVALPGAQPNADPAPVVWKWTTPIAFTQREAFSALVHVRADAPTLAQDPLTSKSFALALGHNGKLVQGTLREIAAPEPVMQTGDVVDLKTGLAASGVTFAEGDTVELWVYSHVPQAQPSLSVVIGGKSASTLDLESITAAGLPALKLATGGHNVSLLAEFAAPPTARVLTVSVYHDGALFEDATVPFGSPVLVAFSGAETPADARAHHTTIDAAARAAGEHTFTLARECAPGAACPAAASVPFAVHPGTVVLVPLTVNENWTIACKDNCPGGKAFAGHVRTSAPATTPTTTPTSGSGTSSAATKGVSAAGVVAAFAAASVAAAWVARRRA